MGALTGLVSAVCWITAYILIIRRSHLDRTYGIPFAAICANISWEFVFSFIYPEYTCVSGAFPATPTVLGRGGDFGGTMQEVVNIIWFGLDALILYSYVRFGRREFTPLLPKSWFLPGLATGLVIALVLIGSSATQFNDCEGLYSAFGINLMMSIMFCEMLLQRGSARGQSLYIAVFKMVGTLGASLHFFLRFPTSTFLNSQYLFILAFDLLYIAILYNRLRKENIDPLRRF